MSQGINEHEVGVCTGNSLWEFQNRLLNCLKVAAPPKSEMRDKLTTKYMVLRITGIRPKCTDLWTIARARTPFRPSEF